MAEIFRYGNALCGLQVGRGVYWDHIGLTYGSKLHLMMSKIFGDRFSIFPMYLCPFLTTNPIFSLPIFLFLSITSLSFYLLLPTSVSLSLSLSLLNNFCNLTKSEPNSALMPSLCGFAVLQLELGFHYTKESKKCWLMDGLLEVKRN